MYSFALSQLPGLCSLSPPQRRTGVASVGKMHSHEQMIVSKLCDSSDRDRTKHFRQRICLPRSRILGGKEATSCSPQWLLIQWPARGEPYVGNAWHNLEFSGSRLEYHNFETYQSGQQSAMTIGGIRCWKFRRLGRNVSRSGHVRSRLKPALAGVRRRSHGFRKSRPSDFLSFSLYCR